jgi:hypothetical protein
LVLRQDLVEKSTPFLPPGVQVRQAFIGQAAPSFAYFVITYLTGLTMSRIKYRLVVVTHYAIYVLDSTKTSGVENPGRWWARCPDTLSSAQPRGDGPKSVFSVSATGSTSVSSPRSPAPTGTPASDTECVRTPQWRILS